MSVTFHVQCNGCGVEADWYLRGWSTCLTMHYCPKKSCQQLGRRLHGNQLHGIGRPEAGPEAHGVRRAE